MSVFNHPDFDHHQLLAFKEDEKTGLKAIIAVHDNTLGPALGGCRMYPYSNEEDAIKDVLRLSRGMTYKSALAGLPLGGGKSVIIGNPKTDKSKELLHSMGEFIDGLGGQYIGAEDSGTGVSDINTMAKKTRFVSGIKSSSQYAGDPSPSTAYGVFRGIEAAVAHKLSRDLKGIRVAIQGIGNVGFYLAEHLVNAGAVVFAADVNQDNLDKAVKKLGVTVVSTNEILSLDVDVLAPCALGGAISCESIKTIKAPIIAGAANNQLATPEAGVELTKQGVLYAPDFVINAGGIIDAYFQYAEIDDEERLQAKIEKIAVTLTEIFKQQEELNLPTSVIAERKAQQCLKDDIPQSV